MEELRYFVNVAVDDFVLLVAWLVNCFRPNRPFPALVLHGEHGSAKSTTSEVLRSLVDPNKSLLRSLPRNERDLAIAANNSWLMAFDNLSGISANTSDALARLSTGGGLATRELYSDSDEILFNALRPILANGINQITTRPDLNDRSLQIICPTIPDRQRRTKDDFNREFEEARPRIFGALLDKVSEGLRNLPNIVLERLPRMADFAKFGTAAFGTEFSERYNNLREESNMLTLESSSIGSLILRHMEEYSTWEGTASEFLSILEDMVSDQTRTSKYFPKEPNQLSRELNRLKPNLRAVGIGISRGKGVNRRNIILERVSETSSSSSLLSPTSASWSAGESFDDDDNIKSNQPRDDDDDNDDELHSFTNELE